jgi:hypothetical protein
VERAVAAADEGKPLLAVKITAIGHLGPIVLDVYNGEIRIEGYDK